MWTAIYSTSWLLINGLHNCRSPLFQFVCVRMLIQTRTQTHTSLPPVCRALLGAGRPHRLCKPDSQLQSREKIHLPGRTALYSSSESWRQGTQATISMFLLWWGFWEVWEEAAELYWIKVCSNSYCCHPSNPFQMVWVSYLSTNQ